MNNSQINNIINSEMFTTKSLDILNTRTSVSSISENDKFTSEEIERFLLYS